MTVGTKKIEELRTDGIILDVDGTLWDSTSIVARAWTRAVQEGGCPDRIITADDLKQQFGKTMDVIADNLLPELPPAQRYAIMDQCCIYEHQELEQDECRICYPQVIETIRALSRKKKLFIVSNCQSGYIELFLRKTELAPYITDFECFGNTGKNKDENIRLTADRNGLKAPVYVGDTQGDLEASEKAGVPFIFASYGFGSPDHCTASIGTFDELLRIEG